MLTLYDDVFSPYARKVRIALYEKCIPFERINAFHGDRTEFRRLNPRVEVPALVDGVCTVYDSTIICEYLEERCATPALYPKSAEQRARCRMLEDLADTQLDAALYGITLIEFARGEQYPAMRSAVEKDLGRIYDYLDRTVGDGPYLCGEHSLADVAFAPHLMAALFLGFPMHPSRHANLVRWYERLQERPSIARDNADVLQTLQKLREANAQAFDPWKVQWRSDRVEWVMKHGFSGWFAEEMRADRTFFPLVD